MKNEGLLERYNISKTDGSKIDPRAKYFVLRYDLNGSDMEHLLACRKALRVYAEAIKDHLPQLSVDLKKQLL